MIEHLPKKLLHSLLWYFYLFPKYLYVLLYRCLVLLNYRFSLTLNLKLLFTPLFGDYTKIGRIIGFFVRTAQVVIGLFVVLVFFSIGLFIPLIWLLLPFIFAYLINVLTSFLVLIGILCVYLILTLETPLKRVSHVNVSDTVSFEDVFRPKALLISKSILREKKFNVEATSYADINLLLQKLELNNEPFSSDLFSNRFDLHDLENDFYHKLHAYSVSLNTRYFEPEVVFLSFISLVPNLDVFLSRYDSSLEHFEQAVDWIISERERKAKVLFWQPDFALPKMGGIGRGLTGRITPRLNSMSVDLTKKAQEGSLPEVVAHTGKIKLLADILSKPGANVMLIGPPGCGKTSVIKGLAHMIVQGTDIDGIKFKRVVSLDTSSLLAGARGVGDISARIKDIIEEIHASNDIILFFDEIHSFVSGVESGDSSSIFSLLEPHISNKNIKFIGATNLENYRKYIEPNGAFARLFEVMEIPEASKEDTLEVLRRVSFEIEATDNVLISYPAIKGCIDLSQKLMHERVFPDKALGILRRVARDVSGATNYVTLDAVKKVISDITHVPITALSQDESAKLLSLGDDVKARVIGQDHAVDQIAKALQRARVGLRDEKKPIASFLFVGTTGVGKTETAKALANIYFGDEKAMIRLDMSEYQQQDSISRLIGDPNGTTKGILTEAVRTRPFSLILLDEIEKAYSSILLTFLQVLDDGRLTDSSGITVDFTNSLIIATSNVGTRSIQEVVARNGGIEEMNEVALREVRDKYAPEFLNRFTGLIVFNPLDKSVVSRIADLMLNSVRKMAAEQGIKISFSEELILELVNRGYNPDWGAREMRRVIEDTVETYIARKILMKDFNKGDQVALGLEVFE